MILTNKKGFTLVELIIVIAIIAVLASLAFMSLSGETAQARDSKRDNDIKTFENAIATSNGKNKQVKFSFDNLGKNSDGNDRIDDAGTVGVIEGPDTHNLETNTGIIRSIRGAYLLPMQNGLFDSDVLPTATVDPKGAPYLTAFLSSTDYLFFATKENPGTKQPTAMVKGTFKNNAILDILNENIASAQTSFRVANPTRFVAGDIILIDEEYMVVRGYDAPNFTISVYRGYDPRSTTTGLRAESQVVHNKGAAIKLYQAANKGNSLACLASRADIATIVADSTGVNDYAGTFAFGGVQNTAGAICGTNSEPLVDGGGILPYSIK